MTDQPTAPNPSDPLNLNDTPGMGHNAPPPYDVEVFSELDADAKRFVDVSNEWLDVEVNTDALAGQITDQINGLRKMKTRLEAARKKAKQPHIERGEAVDAAYNGVKELVQKALEDLMPKLSEFSKKKEAAAAEERRRREEEARRAHEEARLKAMDAEKTNNIEAQVEADRAKKEAEAKEKAASKPINTGIKSASGAGRTISTRKRKFCTIKNVRHLFMHYQDRQEVHDLLLRLANAEANAAGFPDAGSIPGVEIEIKTTVV